MLHGQGITDHAGRSRLVALKLAFQACFRHATEVEAGHECDD